MNGGVARGFTLIEVLITMIILAVGMLGLANLQSKIHITEVESYQRAHAVLLLQDMVDRMNSNRGNATSYVNAQVVGTGGLADATAPCNPTAIAVGATRDRCEWGKALLGAAETSGGNNAGAMIGARGCVEQLQASNPADGVCTPGIYRVSIAWQGLAATAAPNASLTCGANQYGVEAQRRIVTTELTFGTLGCNPP